MASLVLWNPLREGWEESELPYQRFQERFPELIFPCFFTHSNLSKYHVRVNVEHKKKEVTQ